jgi:DNA-binding GntR family transcriptional regulator
MEAEGFFARESRFLMVASLDQQSVVELYAKREVLEGTAAAFAAQQASSVEVATLLELCDIEARMLGRHEDIVRHNERFHLAIYGAAHNRYLLKSLAALRDTRMLLGPTTLSNDARVKSAHEEHKALVGAIERRDAAAAEAAARHHIRSAARERLRTIGD